MTESRNILVVVDMQNDFIDGSLGSAEARAVVRPAVEKIEKCKREGVRILVTMDTHGENYLSTQEGRRLPVPHCVKGTHGWRLNGEIAAAVAGCKVYEKTTFASADLLRDLVAMRPERVELIGLCTDICVVSNALGVKAVLPETCVVVDASCCAGVTPRSHDAAVQTMKSCQIDVI